MIRQMTQFVLSTREAKEGIWGTNKHMKKPSISSVIMEIGWKAKIKIIGHNNLW